MASRFLIYGLTDPRTGEVRYIGQSSTGLVRPRGHGRPSVLASRHTHLYSWIRAVRALGLEYGIRVLEWLPGRAPLPDAERRWIARGRRMGWDLTNHTSGGEGCPEPDEATREKMRRAKIGKRRAPRSAEWRSKLSAAMMGRKPKDWTPERRAIMSARMKGNRLAAAPRRPYSDETRKRMSEAQLRRPPEHTAKIGAAVRATLARKYSSVRPPA